MRVDQRIIVTMNSRFMQEKLVSSIKMKMLKTLNILQDDHGILEDGMEGC